MTTEIQCHECGATTELYVCPYCYTAKSVPVQETWEDLAEQIGICFDCDPPHGLNLCPDCTHDTTTSTAMAHHMNTVHGYAVTAASWWKDF